MHSTQCVRLFAKEELSICSSCQHPQRMSAAPKLCVCARLHVQEVRTSFAAAQLICMHLMETSFKLPHLELRRISALQQAAHLQLAPSLLSAL